MNGASMRSLMVKLKEQICQAYKDEEFAQLLFEHTSDWDYAGLNGAYDAKVWQTVHWAHRYGEAAHVLWLAKLVASKRPMRPGLQQLVKDIEALINPAGASAAGTAAPGAPAGGVAPSPPAPPSERTTTLGLYDQKLSSLDDAVAPPRPSGSTGAEPTDVNLAPSCAAAESVPLTMHAFVSGTNADEGGDVALVSCVVLERPDPVRSRLRALRDDLLHDPHLRNSPAVLALRRRQFSYESDDPDVRAALVDTLVTLPFEAYVFFASKGNDERTSRDELFQKLAGGLLRDRFRSERSRGFEVRLDPALESWLERLRAEVARQIVGIERSDKRGVKAAPVALADLHEPCIAIAGYVGGIVRARVAAPEAIERRTFDRLHPSKIRLVHEFGTNRFYTRDGPLR